jgi:hypothetical protein
LSGRLVLDPGLVPCAVLGVQAVWWQGADRWLELQGMDPCSGLLQLGGEVAGALLGVAEAAGGVVDVGDGAVVVEPSGSGPCCRGGGGLCNGGLAGRCLGEVVGHLVVGMIVLGGLPSVSRERRMQLGRPGVQRQAHQLVGERVAVRGQGG